MRSSIVLDDRDVEILAAARKNVKPALKKLSIIGFVAIVIGGFLEVSGHLYGFFIMGAGAIVLGIAAVFASRQARRSAEDFKKYVDTRHETPPWPEK